MRRAPGGAYLGPREAARDWKSALAVGAVSVVLGLAAILFPLSAAFATEVVVGVVLVLAGAFEAVGGMRGREPGTRLWMVSLGAVALVAGALLLAFPRAGMFSLAFVVGVVLLAQGVVRMMYGWRRRHSPGAGWWLGGGALATFLGALILLSWPGIAPWLLGVLVGIDLIVSGWRNVAIALTARRGAAA